MTSVLGWLLLMMALHAAPAEQEKAPVRSSHFTPSMGFLIQPFAPTGAVAIHGGVTHHWFSDTGTSIALSGVLELDYAGERVNGRDRLTFTLTPLMRLGMTSWPDGTGVLPNVSAYALFGMSVPSARATALARYGAGLNAPIVWRATAPFPLLPSLLEFLVYQELGASFSGLAVRVGWAL